MPITMGGISSGIDTDGIITKLVDVESQPIKKIQAERVEFTYKNKALEELSIKLKDMDSTVKDLYGFRASYDDKKVISSHPELVEAVATKMAQKGIKYVFVEQLAGNHKIITDTLPLAETLPAGEFTLAVGNETKTLSFRGGSVQRLREQMDSQFSSIAQIGYAETMPGEAVIFVESKTPGKNGEIKLSGDLVFLRKLGLAEGYKEDENQEINLVFDSKYFEQYIGASRTFDESGTLEVAEDGKSVQLSGVLWREYVLPTPVVLKKESVFSFESIYTSPEQQDDELESLPYKVELGPSETTIIKGIGIDSYNVSRERPLAAPPRQVPPEQLIGIGVIYMEGDIRTEKLFTVDSAIKERQEIPVGEELDGKSVERVIFYANNGSVSFQQARFITPLDGPKTLQAKNEAVPARNAVVKIDDIRYEREKNEGLTDLVKGLTLNLRGQNPETKVELNVEHDIDKSIEKIKKFITAYNAYVEYNAAITKAPISSSKDDFKKTKEEKGLLMGDMTIMRLENSLKTSVASAYPNPADEPIKMLSQIGISTGKVNSAWSDIKQGKLQLDEDLLREKIMANPEGVKNLFGSDNDGDRLVDGGFAWTVETTLKPYVQPGKNMIVTQIDMNKESISRADERIKKQSEHLQVYEDKLRRKFSNMEQNLSSSKSQRDWMNNNMSGGQAEK